MSVWGKVIGGMTGFALGGPLGALLGTVAGHAVDRLRGKMPTQNAMRQAAFATAMIVLCAKMAKADGVVTRDEIDAFKSIFRVPDDEMKAVGMVFDKARQDAEGFEPYAQQAAGLFAHDPAVLEELLGGLFHIAKADGVIHPTELDFLRQVATIFGFSPDAFERIRASYVAPDEADPYQMLGLSPTADDATVKSTYRDLVRKNHPDKLMAEGLPQEFIDLATEKMAAINGAYDRIRKARGIK